jgi:hypothetical protein
VCHDRVCDDEYQVTERCLSRDETPGIGRREKPGGNHPRVGGPILGWAAGGGEGATIDDWENDPLWLIGTDATIADVTDGSVNHDLYLYGPLSEAARAEIKD